MYSGIFSMRLYFHDVELDGPFESNTIAAWRNKPPNRLDAWKMRACIYSCSQLPPADSEGTSDPYVQVWTSDEKKITTQVVDDTNNPIYYQVLEYTYDYKTVETAPPIILNVFDKDEDLFDSTDDLIGRAIIPLQEIIDNNNLSRDSDEIVRPFRYPIKKFMNQEYDIQNGPSILVSFQMTELDQRFDRPANEIDLDD